MKTNVPVELTDLERNMLAQIIDGKQSQRTVSRKEVNEIVRGCFDSLVHRFEKAAGEHNSQALTARRDTQADLLLADPEDAEELRGKSGSYIIGWNKAKARYA